MIDFGSKLKNLRKEHKITQRDLADSVGVDFTYISKMENGKLENSPSIETIIKIANVLETNADELLILANKIPETIRKTIVDDNLAAAFLRKVPQMTDEQRKRIQGVIDEV